MHFDIPFIRPVFPSAELIAQDFRSIVSSNWYTNFGPLEREFARAVADYVGDEFYATTFNNATTALIAALHTVLGQGDGEKHVLVPSFTFAAGPEAIEWAGYRPLFIDIDEGSLQPSLAEAQEVLEGDRYPVVGILLGNTFGIGNAEIGAWENLAEKFSLPLIIDSAAGFGSRYKDDRRVGGAGLCEIFSFHATKPFAIGEGGAVVTRDPELAARLKAFENFGFSAGVGATTLGTNGKLQEINAAIGLRQLENFDEAIQSRQNVLARYRLNLDDEQYQFPEGIERSSICFATLVAPNTEARDVSLRSLLTCGIEARAYYSPAVHAQPHFKGAARVSALSTTELIVSKVLSVPVHQRMADDQVDRVISALREATHEW